MRREYIFIIVTILLALSGIIYKGLLVSDKLDDTQKLIIDNNDKHARFNRDTLIQSNREIMKNIYESNKRDDRSYGEVIAELLKTTEDILKDSGIKYDVNDINQEIDEKQIWPQRKTSFFINVNFESNYKNFQKLLVNFEKHENLINLSSIDITRKRPATDKGGNNDEYGVKSVYSIRMRLEYIKFL